MRRLWIGGAVAAPLALSALAFFFALGGSALATDAKSAKCGAGTVRGIALVTGDKTGITNIPDTYTSKSSVFGFRYNCAGKGVQVKHAASLPAYDVRFPGNPSRVAMASAVDTTAAMTSVQRQPDGAFRVFLVVPSGNDLVGRADLHFLLVAY
jgi:hypothetical protein